MPDARAKVISINRTARRLRAICDNIVILGQDEEPPSIPDDDSFIASIVKLGWQARTPPVYDGDGESGDSDDRFLRDGRGA
jgi:hypothetical protein